MAPPQINSLWMEQQLLQKLVELFKWNYIDENKLGDDDDDNDDNDNDNDNDDNNNDDNNNDDNDDNKDNDNNNNLTTRLRGDELRSAIPVPTSNNLTPPPPVVAITLLPMAVSWALLQLNNFSNFCLFARFDSSKCS